VLNGAENVGKKLAAFLQSDLDGEAMTRQIDSTLYRNRTP
jgi:hypothetical protein